MIKEGQVIGYLDQFGTELPVKVLSSFSFSLYSGLLLSYILTKYFHSAEQSDVAGEVLKLLFDDGGTFIIFLNAYSSHVLAVEFFSQICIISRIAANNISPFSLQMLLVSETHSSRSCHHSMISTSSEAPLKPGPIFPDCIFSNLLGSPVPFKPLHSLHHFVPGLSATVQFADMYFVIVVQSNSL